VSRWAVLIGINGYHESLGPLSFCVNDAKLMQEALMGEACGFAQENTMVLTDDQPKDRLPTFGNIHSWLGTWLSRPGADDLVLVYFAGHGREANGSTMLAPMDATLESLPVTGIPIQYVRDLLDRCKARQKVLILDACHSGAGRDVAAMTSHFRESLDAGKGIYTIAACDADQISYEWPEKQHGVFTHFLAEAIREAAAPDPDGCVTLDRVYDYTREKVCSWTAGRRIRQEPVRICRVSGQIGIAARSLTPAQQLERAKAEIVRLRSAPDQQYEEPSQRRDVFRPSLIAEQQRQVARSKRDRFLRAGIILFSAAGLWLATGLTAGVSPGIVLPTAIPVALTGLILGLVSLSFGPNPFDVAMDRAVAHIAPHLQSGHLALETGGFEFEKGEDGEKSRERLRQIRSIFASSLIERGFRLDAQNSEAVLEILSYSGSQLMGTQVMFRVTASELGKLYWEGAVTIFLEDYRRNNLTTF
jgi:hypothetical protein